MVKGQYFKVKRVWAKINCMFLIDLRDKTTHLRSWIKICYEFLRSCGAKPRSTFCFFLFSFCCQPAVMRAITANPLSIRNNNFWLQLSKVVISGSFWNFSQIVICKCACNLRQGSPCKGNALLEYLDRTTYTVWP